MKAINWNSKYMLTAFLLGLLAMNTNWQRFADDVSAGSVSLASSSSVCGPDSHIVDALIKAKNSSSDTRVGHGAFYFTPLKRKYDGKTVEIEGLVNIRAYSGHETRTEGGASATATNMGSPGSSASNEVIQVPGMVYEISVNPQPTEGSICTDCLTGSSEVKKIFIANSENVSAGSMCHDVYEKAKSLFNKNADNMLNEANEILQAAEDEELQEELEDEAKEECIISDNMPVDEYRKYKDGDDIDEDYLLDTDDQLKCHLSGLRRIKDREERSDRYFSDIAPLVRELLASPEKDDQKKGEALLRQLRGNKYVRSTPGAIASLGNAESSAKLLTRVRFLEERSSRGDEFAKLELENIRMQAEYSYKTVPSHMMSVSGRSLSTGIAEDNDFWYDTLTGTNSLTGSLRNSKLGLFLDDEFIYRAGSRGERGVGDSELYRSFAQLKEELDRNIRNGYNPHANRDDRYERNPFRSNNYNSYNNDFRRTSPPRTDRGWNSRRG